MRRHLEQMRSGDDGAAAVEFALVWFVLIVLLLGIIQFGVIFSQWLQLSHAAREGARWASLRNPVSTVQARVRTAAPFASDANIVVSPDPLSVAPGDQITVTVTRVVNSPLAGVSGMGLPSGGWGGSTLLRARASQRAE